MQRFGLVLIAILAWGCSCSAQVITMTIVTAPGGITLTGSGTPAGVMTIGAVQAFGGTVPSGVTKSVGANSWTLTTPIDLDVSLTLGSSPSYSLTAQLTLSDATNTWKLNAITLSTTASTITNSHAYGTAAYTFSLTIPFSAAATTIVNTVDLIATAN